MTVTFSDIPDGVEVEGAFRITPRNWKRTGTARCADRAPRVLRCGCVPGDLDGERCSQALFLREDAECIAQVYGLGSAEHHHAVVRLGRHFTQG